ncbi:TrkA family potassium uptake protein [Paraconexibacter antarcticus]|uniref:TrkA family potassium uptake protein n=1 Tax=Paraconexibacter antarcticus TaxID=2949664 RepID=A0ABY5E0F1_9ACTN|nr:TrkA family potassium uptake protein [Paraconexibacter antarcticus]UTI66632.1 TrkA family potassium uptake protein [Paraconexibacter antarcticus]
MSPLHGELSVFARRMSLLGAVILGLVAVGTLGFVLTEDETVWAAFNRSLDVIATTGSIPAPTDTGGQIVKVVLTLLGVGTLFYALVTVAEFFVAGHVGELLADRRNARMLAGMTDHHIVCGYGRVGRQVARDLRAAGARYVVIDPDPVNIESAQGQVGVRAILGEPSDDVSLHNAGIERAKAIIACVDSDAENIFITLTARELRSDIVIVARASVDGSEAKLRRAGADRVISPYKSSGTEMARLALHPQVSGSVDHISDDYRVEEIEVAEGAEGVGMALADVRGGSIIAALRRDGRFQPQPPGDTVLRPGDVVVAMGTPQTMDRLENLFA